MLKNIKSLYRKDMHRTGASLSGKSRTLLPDESGSRSAPPLNLLQNHSSSKGKSNLYKYLRFTVMKPIRLRGISISSSRQVADQIETNPIKNLGSRHYLCRGLEELKSFIMETSQSCKSSSIETIFSHKRWLKAKFTLGTHLNCTRYSIKFRFFISTIISTIKLERQSLCRKRFIRHLHHAIDNQVLLHYLIYNRSVASISSTWRGPTTAPGNSVPLNWRGIKSSLLTSFIYKVNFQTLSPKGKDSFYPYHSRLKPLLDKFNYFTDLVHPGTFKVPLIMGTNSSKTFNRFAINYDG